MSDTRERIEKLINELWAKYKADNKERDGRTFISGERAKRLDDGRSFTASVISEILSFANYIDYDLYADMSKVRKRRKRMHLTRWQRLHGRRSRLES